MKFVLVYGDHDGKCEEVEKEVGYAEAILSSQRWSQWNATIRLTDNSPNRSNITGRRKASTAAKKWKPA